MRKYYNKNKLADALNSIYILAEHDAQEGEEQKQLNKSYDFLMDFIDSLSICERATCNNIKAQNHDHDYCTKHL